MTFHGGPTEAALLDNGQSLKVRIPPNARFIGSVRHEMLAFAGRFQIAKEDLQEFIVAVGEALANAIEHSRSTDVIEVCCQIEGERILATIVDSGAGFESERVPNASLPEGLAERGRGLTIMRHCTDIFVVHSIPGRGTAVVLGRYLSRRHL